MKKTLCLFTLVAAAIQSGLAQAPASISGLTLRGHNDLDTGVIPVEVVFSIDFFPDGTFNAHFQADRLLPNFLPFTYKAPVTGSYSYKVTAPNLATVSCNPPILPGLVFSSGTEGIFDNGGDLTRYSGHFDLSPTGGVGSSRALVNMSVLLSVSRGSTTSFGFVVGGTSKFREILIRAVGPSLGQFGINNYAANPVYALNRADQPTPGQALGPVGRGAGWSASTASSATLSAESVRVGAFSLLQGSNDKADIFLLAPGAYTISVTPLNASEEGAELVEVYEVE